VTAEDVLQVLDRLEAAGIDACLDGGWGVDGLIGRETRAHSDLDLVVQREDLAAAEAVLVHAGFAQAPEAWPGLPARLVLRDAHGRQIDFHPITIDEAGQGRQDLGDGRFGLYPAEGLRGEGRIAGRKVRCITAELQMAHHRGYELPEHERRDLELLAERLSVQ
jgi:lincosamide nucleotidyltransferase A/C/D/E